MSDNSPNLNVDPARALADALGGRSAPQVIDPPPEDPRPSAEDSRAWSTTDKALQAAFTAAALTDWVQTHTGIIPKGSGFEEANPLLGKHPSPVKLALGAGGATLAHALVSHYLPQPYRRIWQLGGLGVEAGVVQRNHHDGVRVNLRKLF